MSERFVVVHRKRPGQDALQSGSFLVGCTDELSAALECARNGPWGGFVLTLGRGQGDLVLVNGEQYCLTHAVEAGRIGQGAVYTVLGEVNYPPLKR